MAPTEKISKTDCCLWRHARQGRIKRTSEKVTYLYDLMDAAYDAKGIEEINRSFGPVKKWTWQRSVAFGSSRSGTLQNPLH